MPKVRITAEQTVYYDQIFEIPDELRQEYQKRSEMTNMDTETFRENDEWFTAFAEDRIDTMIISDAGDLEDVEVELVE